MCAKCLMRTPQHAAPYILIYEHMRICARMPVVYVGLAWFVKLEFGNWRDNNSIDDVSLLNLIFFA